MTRPPPVEQPYIEYLDKESTLVGLLATFAVASAGLLLQATLGAKDASQAAVLWVRSRGYVASSAALGVTAAVAFFRERSLLAYYIGQLSLAHALGGAPPEEPGDDPMTTTDLLLAANSWSTWFWYQVGWIFLGAAAAAFVAGLVASSLTSLQSTFWQFIINVTIVVLAAALALLRSRLVEAKDAASQASDAASQGELDNISEP